MQDCMFLVKRIAFLLALLALPVAAHAQSTATVDWTTLGAPSAGALSNPSTATASDGTTATVSYSTTSSGAAFTPIFTTPLSYYDPVFGGIEGTLLMNFDNPSYDPGDKLTTLITLNRAVTGLQFSVTDIDSSTWIDAIEVSYDNGDGVWRNAADNPAFYAAGAAATRTSNGIVDGWRGTANVVADRTTGNVSFNFANTPVRRVRIVYFSYSYPGFGSTDPAAQAAGISDLTFNGAFADLSLTKTLLTASPATGSTATFRLILTNAAASSLSATGIEVRDNLPTGFSFTNASGTGSFDPGSGIWRPGTLARGQSASIDISGTVTATNGATLTNRVELTASNQPDPDSTPNNGAMGEDDYATATLTVGGSRVAGVPPTLVCPNQSIVFDWDAVNWPSGSTSNAFALGTLGSIRFTLANDGAWLNLAAYGGQSPTRQNTFTGGITPDQFSLAQIVNHTSQAGRTVTTIALPEIMRGAQFRLFDVDSAPGQFADLVTVEGSYQGASVIPTMTNGISNYVIGNSAYGDGASDSPSSDGNVWVTFAEPIDTIIVRYGNHSAAPVDPGQQGIGIHDITLCRPTTTILAEKTSRVLNDSVDVNDVEFNIPGAVVEYCLLASNTGDTRATDIRMSDVIPASMTYVIGSIRSGTNCTDAATVEDDDDAGADERDPAGAYFLSGGEIRTRATELAAGATVAFTFQASIN